MTVRWTAECAEDWCGSYINCSTKSARDDWTILHMNATGHAVKRTDPDHAKEPE